MHSLPWRALLASGLATALVLAPWTIRNRVVMGDWLFIRDNLGLELAVSNNDLAQPRTRIRSPVHPNTHRGEAQRIVEVGEVEYNREKMAQALTWISQHPSQFARLRLRGARYFWWPETDSTVRNTVHLLVLLAALSGFVLALVRRIPALTELACGALGYSSLYHLVQAESRYEYPIQWVVCLLAASAVAALVEWRRATR